MEKITDEWLEQLSEEGKAEFWRIVDEHAINLRTIHERYEAALKELREKYSKSDKSRP